MRFKAIWTILVLLLFISPLYAQINSVSVVRDPVFGTNDFVLLVNVGTLYSDKLTYGRISEAPSYLSDKLGNNYKVENPLILEWKTIEEYTKYNLYKQRTIYYVDIRHLDCGILGCSDDEALNWVHQNCYDFDKDGQATYVERTTLGRIMDIWCSGLSNKAGDVYTISSPQPYWKTQFKLSNGKDTETFYIGTNDGYTKRIGNKAFIRFSGLTLFSYPTNPSNVYAFKSNDRQTIIDSQKYQAYLSYANDDFYDIVYEVASGQLSELDAESQIRNKIDQMKYSWTTNADFPKNNVEFSPTEPTIKLHSTQKIAIQNFNMYLNGNWIGIIIPKGEPKITKIDYPDELTATETAQVKVHVQNVGDGDSTFEVSLTCDSPISVFVPKQLIQIGKGETKEVDFTIGSIQQREKQTISCKATAIDTSSQSSTTKSFSFNLKPMAECDEGEQMVVVEGGTYRVLECENGQFSKIVLACGVNEVPHQNILGKYDKCVPIQQYEQEKPTTSSSLSFITGLLTAQKVGMNIVASILAGLIVFALTRMENKGIKWSKGKIVALAIAVAIAGVIAYYYWWVVLILIGAFLVLKLVVL